MRDHALTVLPGGSSLKALRRVARPSAANKPMIGFGNPLLDGTSTIRRSAYLRSLRSAPAASSAAPRRRGSASPSLLAVRRGVTPRANARRACGCRVPARAGAAARDRGRAMRRGARSWRRSGRNPAWRARHRARGEALERNRPARAVPHRAFRDAWRARGAGARAMPSRASC